MDDRGDCRRDRIQRRTSQYSDGAGHAEPCTTSPINPIACENSKPGNPASEWDISGAGSASIQGFTTDISAIAGETVRFKVDTTATAFRIDIYRLGYYGGQGARKIDTIPASATIPRSQPNCLTDSSTGLIDCGNWSQSASWVVPAGRSVGCLHCEAGEYCRSERIKSRGLCRS